MYGASNIYICLYKKVCSHNCIKLYIRVQTYILIANVNI